MPKEDAAPVGLDFNQMVADIFLVKPHFVD